MGEIIFVILLAGGFFIPAIIARQWWLVKVFGIFFIFFGLVEWWAVAQTDMSVSQHFWALSETNPGLAWFVIGGMAVAWLALLWHFAGKHLLRRK